MATDAGQTGGGGSYFDYASFEEARMQTIANDVETPNRGVNLNLIVNAAGIWPLEFTCRFGYPGFAILDPLQETSWADLFGGMVARSRPAFATRSGFCVGIVEKDAVIDGKHTRPGDVIIGLPSSGPHSNGYSLIRKLIKTAKATPASVRLVGLRRVVIQTQATTRIGAVYSNSNATPTDRCATAL